MGRDSEPAAHFAGLKCHLRRVPMVGGDYDPGGAYWGSGRDVEPLWCVWAYDAEGFEIVAYTRAGSRAGAKSKFQGAMWFR